MSPIQLRHIDPRCIGQATCAGVLLDVVVSTYSNGRLAVLLEREGRPYARWSANVPSASIQPDEFFAKTSDEHEELRAPLLATGLFEDSGVRLEVGFLTLELWRLKGAQQALAI